MRHQRLVQAMIQKFSPPDRGIGLFAIQASGLDVGPEAGKAKNILNIL